MPFTLWPKYGLMRIIGGQTPVFRLFPRGQDFPFSVSLAECATALHWHGSLRKSSFRHAASSACSIALCPAASDPAGEEPVCLLLHRS